MSMAFEKYSDIIFSAYQTSNKKSEIAAKKKEILDEVLDYYNILPTNILFVGFSPCINLYHSASATLVSEEVEQFLKQNTDANVVTFDSIGNKQYDVVVAVDEFLTFADSDSDQRDLIDRLSGIAKKCIITTLRDYKNQDFKNKEFSNPILIKGESKKIYLEHYEYDQIDRNSCQATSYVIGENSVDIIGPFARRNLFFKQLAKFSLDAGADAFLIHKNIMHKSIIKKNYEHIITIKF